MKSTMKLDLSTLRARFAAGSHCRVANRGVPCSNRAERTGSVCSPSRKEGPMTDLIAIAGAGTLGWQIALTFALKGVDVRLYDLSATALERGMELIAAELATMGAESAVSQPIHPVHALNA